MTQIICEVAKYLIIIIMAVYTFQCFSVFKYSSEFERKGIYIRQIFSMVLINFFAFLSLYAARGELKYFRAYLIQQLGILIIIVLYIMIYPTANRLIINNMCMLLTTGLIILTRISYDKAMRQFAIAMAAVIVTMIVPFLISRITFFEKFKWVYVGVGIASLLLVLLFASVTNGSKLSMNVLNYSFQPSEYVKIIFVFGIASILATGKDIKDILIASIVAAAHVLILVASKDLGSAVIFFTVYLCMLFVASRNYLYLFVGILLGLIASVIGYKLFSHVRIRVQAFSDPFGHIEDSGYQIAQSLFAIGTGNWIGLGVGQGAPSTIPVVAADFIFAAICEELGVIFGMCLILVCLSCFIMFMNIAMKFHDRFFKLVAVGLAVSYGFQVFLTVGGVTKFIPLTGVTLPLVSYGGNSIVVTCFVFAVIQGLYIYKGREFAYAKSLERKRRRLKSLKDDERLVVSAMDNKDTEVMHNPYSYIRNNNDEIYVEKIIRKKYPERLKSGNLKPEKGFGNSDFNTFMMDDAFKKAVDEGLKISNSSDEDEDFSNKDYAANENGSVNNNTDEEVRVEENN